MTSILTALNAARLLGLRTSAHYLLYQLVLKSGWARGRTPVRSWSSFAAELLPDRREQPHGRFFWSALDWQPPGHMAWSAASREQAERAGRRILAGEFPLFGSQWIQLGFPPDWHSFVPLAGGEGAGRVAADSHWSRYSSQAMEADIKLLWEPSRFSWVFALGRAFRWTEEEEFAQGFWELLESWLASHEANAGPQWLSAQEAGFRLLALGFARACFAPALSPQQQERMAQVAAAHAARIPPTVAYSRAQRNNHLLTEAVGLLTAGLLFPELSQAKRYTRSGFSWLVSALNDQILDDGGYRQHSANYGRLALQLGLWGSMLCQHNGLALPPRSKQALLRLTEWLGDMVEPENGRTPNFGPNDGSLALPLTSCAFNDYRPTIQAARATLGGKAPYPPGPWDELTSWFGTEPMPQQVSTLPARRDHPHAGNYSFGQEGIHGFLRAAKFDSRPGHMDQLHLDLWLGGGNLALDPGTYLYNGSPPWDNQLAKGLVHNTILVDSQEPMQRVGRFLWLKWSQAELLVKSRTEDGRLELLSAEHDAYRRKGVVHRRTVLRAGRNLLLIVDDLYGKGRHEVHLPWLLPAMEWQLQDGQLELVHQNRKFRLNVESPGLRSSLYSAGDRLAGDRLPGEIPQWGWYSETYAKKEPALHWVSYTKAELPLQIRTWWLFDDAKPEDLELRWESEALPQLRTVHFGGSTLRQ